ncbi:SCO family protein [Mariprofundus ferrinatatus]|uniref:SCO family protein n=1 Tax=Mariprofundus ferrinatatus TaxID=1921087 RepID=UPI0018E1DF6D|nr:SCO family protein [Mariprofundus ferrinatatus]
MSLRKLALTMAVSAVAMLGYANGANAAYGNVTKESLVDPSILKIDEIKFLGEKVDYDFVLQDESGADFKLGSMIGKPLVLAFSYYTCDGACSVINKNLAETLKGVERWKIGQDYNVLTVSFDQNDTPATLVDFMEKSGFSGGQLPSGWKMTTMREKENIEKLTGSMGFKFFWSPRDALFLHPNVYIMLSPKGRVTRYLYGGTITPTDMELAITKAMGEKIAAANVIDFVVGACYSYNYKDGKYTINIPLFVAAGGLIFGLLLIAGSFSYMKFRRVKHEI